MKTTLATILILSTIIVMGCTTPSNNQPSSDSNTNTALITVSEDGFTDLNQNQLNIKLSESTKSTLTQEEEQGLIYMREEEKLAHDVYITLFNKWNQKIFNNISSSEQTHTDAIKSLLEKYSISDPSAQTSIGEFQNKILQDLNDELMQQGEESLIEALKVGVIIEEVDIIDLQKYIKETTNTDITAVYENLLRGSRNHLRAFVKNLNKQGITYSPQYLTLSQYQEIINGDVERGNK